MKKERLLLTELRVVSFETLTRSRKTRLLGGMEALQARYTSCIPPDCPCNE